MGRIVVTEFVTLDGVMEDPGGSEHAEHGGWAFKFDRGKDGNKFKLDELMASDAQLLGRRTFEGFAEAWPSREGEFADKFNAMRKYVVTSTIEDAESLWQNSSVIRPDDLVAEINRLREQEGGDILVAGSNQLVSALIDNDLVDELRLMIFPIALGGGKRLFDGISGPSSLKLSESREVGSDGVLTLVYSRAAGDA